MRKLIFRGAIIRFNACHTMYLCLMINAIMNFNELSMVQDIHIPLEMCLLSHLWMGFTL